MKWLELHLDTQPAGIEPATELLSEYGIDSLMIDELFGRFHSRKRP